MACALTCGSLARRRYYARKTFGTNTPCGLRLSLRSLAPLSLLVSFAPHFRASPCPFTASLARAKPARAPCGRPHGTAPRALALTARCLSARAFALGALPGGARRPVPPRVWGLRPPHPSGVVGDTEPPFSRAFSYMEKDTACCRPLWKTFRFNYCTFTIIMIHHRAPDPSPRARPKKVFNYLRSLSQELPSIDGRVEKLRLLGFEVERRRFDHPERDYRVGANYTLQRGIDKGRTRIAIHSPRGKYRYCYCIIR